jgi:hypothetical protein
MEEFPDSQIPLCTIRVCTIQAGCENGGNSWSRFELLNTTKSQAPLIGMGTMKSAISAAWWPISSAAGHRQRS